MDKIFCHIFNISLPLYIQTFFFLHMQLKVNNLVKTFGKTTAVDNLSFSIKKGEIFGLLGVNGAGKSTTINILSGLLTPDSGKIEMFGKDFFTNREECHSRFNVATAYYHLSHHLTVWQNLLVYAKLYNVKNHKEKIEQLADVFMIRQHFKRKVRTLSSGEKTRMVLVKALLNDPEILFLDECTVGLDPDMAEITRDKIKSYNKDTGCTIVFTSHYMQEVERLCDRIAFMDQGKIIKVGRATELINELDVQKITLHFSRGISKANELLQREGIAFTGKNGIIEFHVKNRKKVIYPLLEKFVQMNIAFDDIHLEKPTLEEYFIHQSRK
jgi:ABC-2 type transport system ATP-binding protein